MRRMRRRRAPPLLEQERAQGEGRADVSTGNGGPPRAPADPARARIAAAMVDLVGSRGYAQTSIEMVCEQARTRRSHFDRCFAGKEDCFLSVHDEVAAEFCERVLAAYAGPSSWHDRIWAAGWAAMRFLAGGPRPAPASSSSRSTAPATEPSRGATGSCSGSPTSSTAAARSWRSPSRSPAAPPKSSPGRSTAPSSARSKTAASSAATTSCPSSSTWR